MAPSKTTATITRIGKRAGANVKDLSAQTEAVRRLLEDGVAARLFPGAVAMIGVGQSAPVCVAAGAHTYDDGARAVDSQTLFDMASLTKVLVTTTAILQLASQQRLSLSDPVGTYLPAFRRDDRAAITLSHLLTHTSGLRADLDLAKLGGRWDAVTAAALWEQIEREPPSAPPGERYVYSDLGFLLLGRIVALVSGLSLDAYADAHIFGPLGMTRTRYCPPSAWGPETAPTEFDALWRGVLVQGQVHDEKAALLGGVAGHAGLFSTMEDLHRYFQALRDCLAGGPGFVLDPALAHAMTQNQTPTLPVRQGLGWFLDQTFLGDLRPDAFGHTGFTGVSVAVSPLHSVHCILLTNCVYPTRPDKETRGRLTEIRAALAARALELAGGKARGQEIGPAADNKGA